MERSYCLTCLLVVRIELLCLSQGSLPVKVGQARDGLLCDCGLLDEGKHDRLGRVLAVLDLFDQPGGVLRVVGDLQFCRVQDTALAGQRTDIRPPRVLSQ